MSKHTPGPWAVNWEDNAIDSPAGNALFWPDNRISAEQGDANLRLAAAAPDLLDALCNVLDACSEGAPQLHPQWIQRERAARAAIVKAEGRT